MRALVTGASGFVGGHLCEHLTATGDLVVGISASGRWPADLGSPQSISAHRALRPAGHRGIRPRRPRAPQATRGDLSPGRPVEPASKPGRSPRYLGAEPGRNAEFARGGQGGELDAEAPGDRGELGSLLWQPGSLAHPCARGLPITAEQPLRRKQGRGRSAGHPALSCVRDRRYHGPAVQPRGPATISLVCTRRPRASGRRSGGRAQGRCRGRQPRRRPRFHGRP